MKRLVQGFKSTDHPHVAMYRAKQCYYNCTQGTNETISDYFNKFNAVVDVVQEHKGRIGDERFLVENDFEYSDITTIPDPDSDEYEAVLATTIERALATGFLLRSDKETFDSILSKLEQYHSIGSDLYPNRRIETLKILNKQLHSNRQNTNGGRDDRTGRRVGRGGGPGMGTGDRGR